MQLTPKQGRSTGAIWRPCRAEVDSRAGPVLRLGALGLRRWCLFPLQSRDVGKAGFDVGDRCADGPFFGCLETKPGDCSGRRLHADTAAGQGVEQRVKPAPVVRRRRRWLPRRRRQLPAGQLQRTRRGLQQAPARCIVSRRQQWQSVGDALALSRSRHAAGGNALFRRRVCQLDAGQFHHQALPPGRVSPLAELPLAARRQEPQQWADGSGDHRGDHEPNQGRIRSRKGLSPV